jgi:hypothetical protein
MKKLIIVSAIAMSITGSVMAEDAVTGRTKVHLNEAGEFTRLVVTGVAPAGPDQAIIAKHDAMMHACEMVYGSKNKSTTNTSTTVETVNQSGSRTLNKNKSVGNAPGADEFIDGKINAAMDANGTSNDVATKKSDLATTKRVTNSNSSNECNGKIKNMRLDSTPRVEDGIFEATYVYDIVEADAVQKVNLAGRMSK